MIKDDRINFEKSLQLGEDGEDVVARFLQGRGNTIIETARGKGKFSDWDLKILNVEGEEKTFEVKTDNYASANIAIEYKSRGKPSGIYSTKADIFLIYFLKEKAIYYANAPELRLWISENSPKKTQVTNYSSDTHLFLIPKTAEIFHRMTIDE